LALAVLGASSFVVSLAGTVAPSLLAAAMDGVPGLALLRDGTRYLGALALLQALLLGFGAGRLVAWVVHRDASHRLGWVVGALCVVAPVAVLPDLAWGAGGRLAPTSYPVSWSDARTAMERDGRAGDVLVLPLSPYRAFPWNDLTPGLDPAGRFFPPVTRTSQALEVDGSPVQEEDPAAARAAELFFAGEVSGLADDAVGYVVITADQARLGMRAAAIGLEPIHQASDLQVFGVPGAQNSTAGAGRAIVMTIAWAGWLLTVMAGLFGLARKRRDARHFRGGGADKLTRW
jgi:hypothetical protein